MQETVQCMTKLIYSFQIVFMSFRVIFDDEGVENCIEKPIDLMLLFSIQIFSSRWS